MRTARLPYVQHQGIDRHPGSVMAMAVNENGTILASGGSQGTWLWNVADMSLLRRPSGASSRGATLVLIWARQTDEAHDVLYGGTQNGYFFCWRQKKWVSQVFEETFVIQIPEPSEITAMAFDSANNRLCLCSRNDIVQSWGISKDPVTGKWTPTNIFSRNQDRDIIVLGFHNSGPVYTLRGKTGETASAWSVGAKIGDAAFHWKDGVFCVEDPYSGPSLFRLSDQIKSNGYEIGRSRGDVRPRKVRFGEQGATLVCGSDHGCVYVFDTRSGAELAVLSVGSTEWVQVVETAEVDDVSVVFAAQTGSLDSSEEIFVWKRAQPARNTGTTLEKLVWVAKALVVLGFLAFVYQNMEFTVGPMRKVTRAFGGAQARTTNLKGSVSADFKGGAAKDSKDFVVVDVRRQL
ncbi:WD40-repeat-containing domain protein [Mycena alexandri]|uniref:WD40-repeat-containing domain protein n=1 Tax=Mycena alexandri TaxID=1745969 RepID=A0AAD6T7C2_9AGAR|nr:WD40-repeat-containing domain protein [Mycena alexandri]